MESDAGNVAFTWFMPPRLQGEKSPEYCTGDFLSCHYDSGEVETQGNRENQLACWAGGVTE